MKKKKAHRGTYNSVDHLQNLGFDKLEILCVPRGSAANDIVYSNVVVLSANTACRLSVLNVLY